MESDLRPGSVDESNYQRPSWWRLCLQNVLYISNKEVKIVAEKAFYILLQSINF